MLQLAKNDQESDKLKHIKELESKKKFYDQELKHKKQLSDLVIKKSLDSCESEIKKIETMVNAIGKETLIELARAGPESQAKILGGLGVKSMLITDGKNPINLFNTSNGLLGNLASNTNKWKIKWIIIFNIL